MRKCLITEKRQDLGYYEPFFIVIQEIGRRKSSDAISLIFILKFEIFVLTMTQLP